MKRVLRHSERPAPSVVVGCALIIAGILFNLLFGSASGAQLGDRSLTLSDNTASAQTSWQAAFTTVSNGLLGSVSLEFCSNTPFSQDPCTAPPGLDTSGAVLTDQTGVSGFAIGTGTDVNHIILTNTPAATPSTAVTFTVSGVINPSSPGSYYMRIQTFASNDATGSASDYGGVAFAILNNHLSVSAEVPPFLIFCSAVVISNLNCATAIGTFVDFGELSMTQANTGSSQLLAATNGKDGYTITMGGNTMASGINIINALGATDVSRPGVSQFGVNLVPNVSPSVGAAPTGPGLALPTANYNQPDFFRFVTGEVLVSNPAPDDVRLYTVSYLVNVPLGQAPGVYASTITYVALANF